MEWNVGAGTHPGESVELGLVARSELTVHGRQRRLFFRKLFVKVASIGTAVL